MNSRESNHPQQPGDTPLLPRNSLQTEEEREFVQRILLPHSPFLLVHVAPWTFMVTACAALSVLGEFFDEDQWRTDADAYVYAYFVVFFVVTCYIVRKKKARTNEKWREKIPAFVASAAAAFEGGDPGVAREALCSLSYVGRSMSSNGYDTDYIDLKLAVLRSPNLRELSEEEMKKRTRIAPWLFFLLHFGWIVWHTCSSPLIPAIAYAKRNHTMRGVLEVWLIILGFGMFFEVRRKQKKEAAVKKLTRELLEIDDEGITNC